MACVTELPMTHVCAIHAIVAAVLNLISQLTVIPAFCQHITKVSDKYFSLNPYHAKLI